MNSFIIDNSVNTGKVIEVRYHDVDVLFENKMILARIKRDLNLVANHVLYPGDEVVITKEKEKYIITNVIRRKSTLTRIKKDGSKEYKDGVNKVIATNIDIAVIVASCYSPALHPGFIDRYLLLLENSNIPFIICLNKFDLKTLDDDKIIDVYKKLNIKLVETSTKDHIGIEELKKMIKGKNAIFVGNSGVGKSSLINSIMDSDEVRVSNIGSKTKRGRHTTTSSKYYIWDEFSSIIDTPGIRSLYLSNFKEKELQYYFKDFEPFINTCKYNDCLHVNEPINSCNIKRAVRDGKISESRYRSYVRILKTSKKD